MPKSWLKAASTVQKAAVGFLLVGFLVLVVRNAWLSDDAYITFRTVDNLIHGYGLTWNVSERVQVYTHPLWMFLISAFYFLTREIFFTSLLVSIGISALAVMLFISSVARSPRMAMLGLAVFSLSKAFVDYATSGLENPLTHLILAGFIWVYLEARATRRWFGGLALLACLGMLNRLDTALFFAPALLWALVETRDLRALLNGVIAFLPLLLWQLFSVFYYGALVPNTALAKLNVGLIPPAELRRAGLAYLHNSWQVDPITLLTIGLGVLVPLIGRAWRRLPLAAGVALYLLYVVRVGGDFMSGRFLTAPLFVAVGLLITTDSRWPAVRPTASKVFGVVLILVLVAVGLNAPHTPLRASGAIRADADVSGWIRGAGVTDERANYYPNAGLLPALRTSGTFPNHDWALDGIAARERGRHVTVKGSVGFFGFFAGPEVHVVDILGLGDPLLARLPVVDPDWHIGHFGRRPPGGYVSTLETGALEIADPNLAAYYARLIHVVQGELLDPLRWREIGQLLLGHYEPLLEAYAYHRGAHLVRHLEVTNPYSHPYVYAYVWNAGAGETFLLDDASVAGRSYRLRWTVTPEGVHFEGGHLARLSSIDVLSDTELLTMGVFFAPDPALETYAIYERRYWFRLEGDRIMVVQPALTWYNPDAAAGFWQERDIDNVVRLLASPDAP